MKGSQNTLEEKNSALKLDSSYRHLEVKNNTNNKQKVNRIIEFLNCFYYILFFSPLDEIQ